MPAPIVVAQHLSPRRVSSLAEILARRGNLPVRTVTDHEKLEAGVIFVVPPNRDVEITDHDVTVQKENGAGPRQSVDLLFRTAAQVFGEDLIAVIFSGSGADGADGAREVKQAGGTVIIQNPDTAAFLGMPLSLAPSTVDIVASPEAIGPLLHDLLTGAYVVPPPADDDHFRGFLHELREQSGIDFTSYKHPTIMRRLQRRMAATGQSTIGDYVEYVGRYPEERQRLIASFLIKVTEFFRDPALFTCLREQVLPELVADARQRGGELRLWSAGCATGEEAYSLAMLVAELLGENLSEIGVRIFATDLDGEAVAYARNGVYPARALAAVPTTLVDKHFTRQDGEYEVKKLLRSLLVFGEHDLGQRAPFPRIDLILCRNVLIYFTAALQRRALQLFAYSLRSGGYLALGKSETVSPLAQYFADEHPRLKVFRRVGERAIIPAGRILENLPTAPARPVSPRAPASTQKMTPRSDRDPREAARFRPRERTEDLVLALPVAVVVVDRNYDIQTINASARKLFGIHTGAHDRDLIHLIQHYPSGPLRHAIDQALDGTVTTDLLIASDDEHPDIQRTIEIACSPMAAGDAGRSLVTICATDVTLREQFRRGLASSEAQVHRLAAANEEVLNANLGLTDTIAKFRAENEELLLATEEVETLNEELQASNEELETLNEEMQATVEELNTTNDDLQARTVERQDLAVTHEAARTRLEAVLGSIGDAVLVVDERGELQMTNPAYDRMFGGPAAEFAQEDETGRPLPPEETPQQRAARGETFSLAFTITAADGARRWYEAEGRPAQGAAGQRGVVMIRDITERSLRYLQDQWLAIASHELRTPLTALHGAIQMAQRHLPAADGTARSRRYLDQSLRQARRASSLIDQMVDATRIQHARIMLDQERVDLTGVATRAVETAEVLARGQTIALDAPDERLTVTGDAVRLEQVLLILLTNAIVYAPETTRIDLRLFQEDSTAVIETQDYGPGISDIDLTGIFDRFRRMDRGARATSGGLGLGLFIAREIVTGHGGTIDARSIVGDGTTIAIRLPLVAIEADRGTE